MNSSTLAIIAFVGISFLTSVYADHGCNGTVTPIDAGSETLYLDDRGALGELSQWFYLETNGIEGLQSGGWVDLLQEPIEPSFPDPCTHRDPDALIIMISP